MSCLGLQEKATDPAVPWKQCLKHTAVDLFGRCWVGTVGTITLDLYDEQSNLVALG